MMPLQSLPQPSLRWVCILAVALATGVCLSARAPSGQAQPPPAFRAGVVLVPLDVRVLDRGGRPVTDLRKEDFTVSEDDVPQTIALFERQVVTPGKPDSQAPLVLRTGRPTEFKPQNRINQVPEKALAAIDESTRAGYLLGYYPAKSLDGKFRRVKVAVKRPASATVLSRQSYRASDAPVPADQANVMAQDRIVTAGEYPQGIPDIPITAAAIPLKGVVTVAVQVDASKIDLPQDNAIGRRTGAIELAFFCSDARQRLVGQVWKKMDLKLTDETYQRLRSGGLTYRTEVVVKDRPRFVKVVIYDYRADRVGSVIVKVQ